MVGGFAHTACRSRVSGFPVRRKPSTCVVKSAKERIKPFGVGNRWTCRQSQHTDTRSRTHGIAQNHANGSLRVILGVYTFSTAANKQRKHSREMETIDFGCQVRCLNRQRIVPGSGHPPLNQCASQFLAKVRKECSSSNFDSNSSGWMKLRLSDRGLRIWPASAGSSSGSTSGAYSVLHRRTDEGFESDSEHSDTPGRNGGSDAMHSGGSSSGVNSSSSDIEEGETSLFSTASSVRTANQTVINQLDDAIAPVRCGLSDILSCQHPPALGRHVVLLTLRSPDDAGLDILALECSAEEPARILTLLCQKIANPGQSNPQKEPKEPQKPVVPIQPWAERAKSPEPEEIKPPSAQNIIRKLERQNSGWNLIQRRLNAPRESSFQK